MPNYNLTNEYQSLSELMGADYDATKVYRIHNNIQVGNLIYAVNKNDKGAVANFTDEIINDAGVNLYLKTNGLNYMPFNNANNVYITEVA